VKDAFGETVCTITDNKGDWSCTPITPLPTGKQTLTIAVVDTASNESSTTITITIGGTTPNVPTIITMKDGSYINTPTPTITGTAEPKSTIKIKRGTDTPITMAIVGSTDEDLCTTITDANGNWACTPSVPLPEGQQTFHIITITTSGIEQVSAPLTITVDITKPSAPVITDEEDKQITLDNPVLSGTAEPNSTITFVVNGQAQGTTTVNEDGRWTFALDHTITAGEYVLDVLITDRAGNTTTTQKTLTIAESQEPGAGEEPIEDTKKSYRLFLPIVQR
jgi:VCBS repeat-containing protein